MVVHVKLLALLYAGAAASAFFVAGLLLDQSLYRSNVGLNDIPVDALCGPNAPKTAFHSEMNRVVARMHAGMRPVPRGNTDRDFTRMMIAHHQGAIDMALVQRDRTDRADCAIHHKSRGGPNRRCGRADSPDR